VASGEKRSKTTTQALRRILSPVRFASENLENCGDFLLFLGSIRANFSAFQKRTFGKAPITLQRVDFYPKFLNYCTTFWSNPERLYTSSYALHFLRGRANRRAAINFKSLTAGITAALSTQPSLASGWGCRGRRLSRG
jgi:hypothetical protein